MFNLCRAVLPTMTEHGGAIVNIGSTSGVVADSSMALYNASKAFVHALTPSIAVDHGPRVRCNAVRPGWVTTEMAADAFAAADDPGAARRDALARHPAGRMGEPADIAGGLTAASPLRPDLVRTTVACHPARPAGFPTDLTHADIGIC